LTRQQIEENDFKAYIASSGSSDSGSEAEADDAIDTTAIVGTSSRRTSTKQTREERRAKLRSLLSGDNDELPEGWGGVDAPSGDIEVTFTPGLTNSTSRAGDGGEETTLERYKRRQKEKKVARKAIQEARAESTGKKAEATVENDKSNVKKTRKKAEYADKEDEDDDHFTADVTDSRFRALHEDPDFAIDPSHPQCVFPFPCPSQSLLSSPSCAL
jgi:NUC153 domain